MTPGNHRMAGDRPPYPRLAYDNPMPAWVPDRAPLSDDGNPARGLAIAILAGAAMWGIGIAIWWAWASGVCR